MKSIFVNTIILFSFIFQSVSLGQTTYTLTFGNNQNYSTTCGDNNASQWVVYYQHHSCYLYTPILNPAGSGMVGINYSFRINQAGNNTINDTLTLELFSPSEGWQVIHTVLGNQYNEVNYDIQGDLTVDASEFIVFRLHAIVNESSSFWAVKKDNTTFTVDNVNPTNDFLPVELISFTGQSENNHARLNWLTYSEVNNHFFTIERSDNNTYFYSAGQVLGAGNSNVPLEYSFTDPDPLISEITYYRLKQTDYDGTSEIFNTIAVRKIQIQQQRMWCYTENANVEINYETTRDEDIHLTVFDSQGKTIDHQKLHASPGINTYLWSFSNRSSGNGLLFIRIIDQTLQVHHSKIIF